MTAREPLRGAFDSGPAAALREPLIRSLRRCAGIPTLTPLVVGYVALNVCFVGWLVWAPAFLMRVHHLTTTKMGLVMGLVVVGGVISTLVSGPVTDWLARRGPRWRLYYACTIGAIAVPVMAASTLVTSLPVAVACLSASTLLNGGLTAISQTTYLSIAPVGIRALVSAVLNVLALGVGGGLAPVLFGAVNDRLRPIYGDQSLRYTLLIAPAMLLVTCVMYFIASRTLDADVGRNSDERR